MRYRLPEGCASVSCGGKEMQVDSDGTIELDPATAAELMPHGIELVATGTSPARAAAGKGAGDGASGGKPAGGAPGGRTPR